MRNFVFPLLGIRDIYRVIEWSSCYRNLERYLKEKYLDEKGESFLYIFLLTILFFLPCISLYIYYEIWKTTIFAGYHTAYLTQMNRFVILVALLRAKGERRRAALGRAVLKGMGARLSRCCIEGYLAARARLVKETVVPICINNVLECGQTSVRSTEVGDDLAIVALYASQDELQRGESCPYLPSFLPSFGSSRVSRVQCY